MTYRARSVWSVVSLASVTLGAGSAAAQFADSAWPGFSGGPTKSRAVDAAGPATELDFSLPGIGTVTPGGLTVAEDGTLYFKEFWGSPTAPHSVVKRISPTDGTVLAMSEELSGNAGDYGGVAIGTDAVYIAVNRPASSPPTVVMKLNKSTLATIDTFTDASWVGIRGTPLIGSHNNADGNKNLYVTDRNGNALVAVDSVTGVQQWRRPTITAQPPFGQIGPIWSDGERDCFTYFANDAIGHAAIKDNGDGTWTELWENPLAGPQNFNWWGSGAMSEDGTRIYVTTFNDNFTPSLWAVSVADGSVIWTVDGQREGIDERNFFGRPAVVGNAIYCGGALNVIAKYVDNGGSVTEA